MIWLANAGVLILLVLLVCWCRARHHRQVVAELLDLHAKSLRQNVLFLEAMQGAVPPEDEPLGTGVQIAIARCRRLAAIAQAEADRRKR